MRQRHTRPKGSITELNLTPLIDMVFILLIFFIVTSSFVKEAGIDVSRPSAQSAKRKERGNILIAISESGGIWMDRRKIDIRRVRSNVEKMHAENPEGAVIILADKDSKTGLLIQVMDQARLAGVSNVSVAAKQDQVK
ncbi:MAG: ExbD/TolR family protein [Nitrospiria bacterium]